MAENLGKALRAGRKRKGLTMEQVGQHLLVTRQAVGNWENGIDEPSTENLLKVCALLDLDVNAVADTPANRPSPPPAPLIGDKPKDVPVFGVAVGGADADFYANGEVIDYVRRPPGAVSSRGLYALYVIGSSMAPRYEEGELIYVSETRAPSIGDYVVVELHPEEGERAGRGYIKRLSKRTGAKVVCEQFNPPKTIEFALSKVKSVHRVVPWPELIGA